MRKLLITGMAVAMLAIPAVASADVTNNPSTNDCHGYATANAVVNIVKEGAMGVTFEKRGIGQFRSIRLALRCRPTADSAAAPLTPIGPPIRATSARSATTARSAD